MNNTVVLFAAESMRCSIVVGVVCELTAAVRHKNL